MSRKKGTITITIKNHTEEAAGEKTTQSELAKT